MTHKFRYTQVPRALSEGPELPRSAAGPMLAGMAGAETTEAVPSARRDPVAGALLIASLPLLAAGLLMPAISITRLALFADTYSILDTVFAFWSSGEYGLFALVFVFSLVFPAAKVTLGLWAWLTSTRDEATLARLLRAFAAVSKWSMLDVFIVALVVLALQGSVLTTADLHAGLVLFAAAVLASTIATQRLARRV